MRSTVFVALFFALLGSAIAQTRNDSSVNARDLFWSGLNTGKAGDRAHPGENSVVGESRDIIISNTGVATATTGDHTHALRAPTSGVLGLRYALLARDAATGNYSEVPPSRIFHAGDHVRLSVMSNQLGYLYIIQQGASGSWSALFPKDGSTTGMKPLNPEEAYAFPPEENSSFQFDQHAGTERLFLVLMRSPAKSVGDVIALLRDSPPGKLEPLLSTENVVSDSSSQSRSDAVASRDLVTTTSDTHQSNVDKAVYVVNRVSPMDGKAMIVAHLAITHQ